MDKSVTISGASKYLEILGFKVSKSKVYADKNAGKIELNPDGSVSAEALVSYAIFENIPRPRDKHRIDKKNPDSSKLDKIALEKSEAEKDLKVEQARREKIKREKDEGGLIERVEVFREFVGRIVVFEQSVKQFVRRFAKKIIVLVDGDITREPELIAFLDDKFESTLNQFSKSKGLIAQLRGKK